MINPGTVSNAQLLIRLSQNEVQLATLSIQLASQTDTITSQSQTIAAFEDVIRQQEALIADWEKKYIKLWEERFRSRSERYIADPDQLRLDFGNTDEAADAAAGLSEAVDEADLIPAHRRSKPKKRDESLPAGLPREEVVIDIPEADKTCDDHGPKVQLPESMWDVQEQLVYVPPTLKVIVNKYIKYACADQPECGIASAERPTGIVEGDKYDTSVATQILVSKYAFHLPLYRQQDMFAGTGWTPSRSTLLNILNQTHFVLASLLEYFKRTVQSDSIVACDDTSVTLLYPKEPPEFDIGDRKQRRMAEVFEEARKEGKPSIRAKMWAYRGVNVALNVFDFTVSRHRDGPEDFFEEYRGTLLGDCWHGFEAISVASCGGILRAACNVHARRYFDNAKDYPADRRQWLDWFQQLYDVNDRETGLSTEARRELRQSDAKPIWDQMRAALDSIDGRTFQVVLPKSDFRKALNYLSNHWIELTRYLDDGLLPMDNNLCEQLMRQAAVGRKNWLFAGSLAGGERNAGFMALVSSAHRNDLDVWAYVNDVLRRLLAGETNYERLLPWNWATDHPNSIRSFRQEERRDRNHRKQTERTKRRIRRKLLDQRNSR